MIVEQTAQNVVNQLTRWHDHPEEFVADIWPEVLLDKEKWAWQRKFLLAIATHDRVAVRSGRTVGKTSALVFVILWWLLTRSPDALILVTANSQDQLKDANWRQATKWIGKMPAGLNDTFEVTSDHIFLKGPLGCYATARTASKERPEVVQGLNAQYMMILVDEASGVDEVVFDHILGSLGSSNAKMVLTGNPTRNSGFFYDAFHRMAGRFKSLHVNCENIPSSSGHIEDILVRHGRESNAYRVHVLGEFPSYDDDTVIPLELVLAAQKRDVAPIQTVMPVWGLDVARFGSCKTALVKRFGNWVPKEGVQTWSKRDTMEVAGIVMHEYEKTPLADKPAIIMVDAIGLGAGVADRLLELGLPVGVINVGEVPSGKDARFLNLRAELWWRAREWLEQRSSKIDNEPLAAELTAPTYSFTSNGKIRIESKEDMLARAVPSPDMADAFILTFAGADRRKEHDLYEKRPPARWRYKNTAWAA